MIFYSYLQEQYKKRNFMYLNKYRTKKKINGIQFEKLGINLEHLALTF